MRPRIPGRFNCLLSRLTGQVPYQDFSDTVFIRN